MYDYDNCAIITIANGQVHLDCTFNTDAIEPIQISSYHHNGWYGCQHCPLLRHAFWEIWDWWNAHVAGSIDLIDNQAPADIDAMLAEFPRAHTPREIAALGDGTYLILDHIL